MARLKLNPKIGKRCKGKNCKNICYAKYIHKRNLIYICSWCGLTFKVACTKNNIKDLKIK